MHSQKKGGGAGLKGLFTKASGSERDGIPGARSRRGVPEKKGGEKCRLF